MAHGKSALKALSDADIAKVSARGRTVHFAAGDPIFTEGDEAEDLYLIETGRVAIFIQRFATRENLGVLRHGDFFGEMVLLDNHRSTNAEALTDVELIAMHKGEIAALLAAEPSLAQRIDDLMAARSRELALKEALMAGCGIRGQNLHLSIKGDPSLRESAFTRERYESPVDKLLDRLCPSIEEILLNRCATEVAIHFNSGEIRIASVFDPFNAEAHPVNKLVEPSYLDRHFPRVNYAHKADLIRGLYASIAKDCCFVGAAEHVRHVYKSVYKSWSPVAPEEISSTLAQLPLLRSIPNFYLRNLAIGMARDAIRMQFNCDGTHIVDTRDYLRFIEENVG